jgi:hypothetical protein
MTKSTTKKGRVLNDFLIGNSHTRFSAARLLNDHCLHSTVASLERDEGIKISRKFITITGYEGSPTRCCLYWLEQDEIDRYRQKQMTIDAMRLRQNRGIKDEKK